MDVFDLFQNKWFRFIAPGVIVFGIIAIFNIGGDRLQNVVEEVRCKETERVKKMSLQGEVVSKYQDERKLNRLKYNYNGETIELKIFINGNADTYELIELGDSFYKKSGSLEFEIRKKTDTIRHILSYGCI